jgi:hypothetical protein
MGHGPPKVMKNGEKLTAPNRAATIGSGHSRSLHTFVLQRSVTHTSGRFLAVDPLAHARDHVAGLKCYLRPRPVPRL